MCGIVCGISLRDVVPIMLNGLKLLEYRGYDSAGMAAFDYESQTFTRVRAQGKVSQLEKAIEAIRLKGNLGIAQTRWATHGKPSEQNAHPHASDHVMVVHNGIIENHADLRNMLIDKGYVFQTETDTEVVPHLIHYYLSQQETPHFLAAVMEARSQLEGAFALGIISSQFPDELLGVRQGAPLLIGAGTPGSQENFIASDTRALLSVTQQFVYLEDGDIAHLRLEGFEIYDKTNALVHRKVHELPKTMDLAERGSYRHYMQKEIFEQPMAAKRTLLEEIQPNSFLGLPVAEIEEQLRKVKRVHIVACGTSYHAGLVGKCWIESLAAIPCTVDIGSEYRYRTVVVEPDTLFITLSQSGETADTLGALHKAKTLGYLNTLAICNVPHSAMTRESDFTLLISAGTEIGVASTKSFIAQLIALLLLTEKLVKDKETIEEVFQKPLHELPDQILQVLALDKPIQMLARTLRNKPSALFLGRGIYYPIAMEGALKMKELSYIHAEAYPAGELKHGPLALIDEQMPVIVIAPNDALLSKLLSNLDEVRARGGELIIFADESLNIQEKHHTQVVAVPGIYHELTAPILYTIPMQLLAYHVAVIKGTDVDQPRNLAKSVTVE